MMPSVAAVDATGRPVGPGLLYGDSRGRDGEGKGEAGADPTASYEMAGLSGWAAAAAPGASGLWPAQAVANAALGGPGTIDLSSAFASGPLFGGSGWDQAICDSYGFGPDQLPRVAMFGEAIGHVAPGASRGEPGGASRGEPGGASRGEPGRVHPGEVVLGAGAVDGLCEQLVAGAVHDGDVLVALGSTLVVWLCVPGWPDEVPGLWRVPHIVAGKAMVGGASNAGGMWVDWADRALRPGEAGPGADHLPGDVPLWWPWARGERVPWHDPSLPITLGYAQLSQGPLALRRAALEATGFVARHIVSLAAAGTGTRPRRFIVSGGGTANPAWVQALADVLGEAVTPMATPEGAALGAAFLARMAAGLETSTDDAVRWARWSAPVQPRRDWAEAAGERYQSWCQGLPTR
jgi:xylulokinase